MCDLRNAKCVAVNLLISEEALFVKLTDECYVWFDYKFTNRYSVRFDFQKSDFKTAVKNAVLLENYEDLFKCLSKKAVAANHSRLNTTSDRGIVIEGNGDGTYSLTVNEFKLYKPSCMLNENKLGEELVIRFYPTFETFKNYYLSKRKPIDIFIQSTSNPLPKSISHDDYSYIVNVNRVSEVHLIKGFLKTVTSSIPYAYNKHFRVFYSRSNMNGYDHYLKYLRSHIPLRDIE